MSKVNIEEAKIDVEAIESIVKKSIDKIAKDDVLYNRAILNAGAEFLAEMISLKKSIEDLLDIATVLSNERIQDFYVALNENVAKEVNKTTKE